MQPLPHIYSVTASGRTAGTLTLTANGVADIAVAAPREFDGPGDEWSPESLFVASLASCFILTFRAAKLEWTRLECSVDGVLERREGVTQFTKFVTRVRLTVPSATLIDPCEKALEKAERSCLVANSLRAERELQIQVDREGVRVIAAAEA